MLYQQPQGGPSWLDPSYSATFALNAALPVDAAGAACVLNGLPAKVATPGGIALRFDTSAKYLAVTRKTASTLGPFNFLYVFSQFGSVVNGGTVLAMPGSSGNNNKIDIYTLTGGTIRADVYNSAGTPTSVDTAAFLVAGGRYALSLIFNGITLQWIVNGQPSGSAVAFSGSRSAESMSFTIGGTAAAAASANHDIEMVAFVGCRTSQLTANPWQLFLDQDEEDEALMFAAAGAGTSYSYTATGGFTLSGAATQSRGAVRSAAGGIQLAGAASMAKGRAITASGGLSISGAATILRGVARSAAGGLQLAGAAGVTFFSAVQTRIVNPVGGITIAGAAAIARSVRYVASGGIAFAGHALMRTGPLASILSGLLPIFRRRRR